MIRTTWSWGSAPRRRSFVLAALLALFLAGPLAAAPDVAPSSRESCLEATQKSCSDCGKRIRFGRRCASCTLGSARERSRDAARKIKRKAREASSAIEKGKRRVREEYERAKPKIRRGFERAKETGRKLRSKAKEAVATGKELWRSTADERRELLERARETGARISETTRRIWADRERIAATALRAKEAASAMWRQAAREYLPAIQRHVRDPATRRALTNAVGAAASVFRTTGDWRQRAAYGSLTFLGGLPVEVAGQRTTLQALARDKLLEKAPFLRGSALAEDPAAVATALICVDRGAFLTDLKLFPSQGSYVTVQDGLRGMGGEHVDTALDVLTLIEATEDISEGRRPLAALGEMATVLHKYQKDQP